MLWPNQDVHLRPDEGDSMHVWLPSNGISRVYIFSHRQYGSSDTDDDTVYTLELKVPVNCLAAMQLNGSTESTLLLVNSDNDEAGFLSKQLVAELHISFKFDPEQSHRGFGIPYTRECPK